MKGLGLALCAALLASGCSGVEHTGPTVAAASLTVPTLASPTPIAQPTAGSAAVFAGDSFTFNLPNGFILGPDVMTIGNVRSGSFNATEGGLAVKGIITWQPTSKNITAIRVDEMAISSSAGAPQNVKDETVDGEQAFRDWGQFSEGSYWEGVSVVHGVNLYQVTLIVKPIRANITSDMDSLVKSWHWK